MQEAHFEFLVDHKICKKNIKRQKNGAFQVYVAGKEMLNLSVVVVAVGESGRKSFMSV